MLILVNVFVLIQKAKTTSPLSCSQRLQHFSQIYVKFLSHRDTAFVSFAVAENFDIHRHTGYTILSRDHYYLLYRHTIYDNIFRRHSAHTHSITHTQSLTHTQPQHTRAHTVLLSFCYFSRYSQLKHVHQLT